MRPTRRPACGGRRTWPHSARKLDPSRLVTFASYRAFRPDLPRPEDEGSHVVDFVSINTMPRPRGWERCSIWSTSGIHGSRSSSASSDLRADKAQELTTTGGDISVRRSTVIRQRPFVAGASVWTFQDYRSRYPDTAPNGYRPWGVVDHLRAPRDAYHVVANEFAAARVVAAPMSSTDGSPRGPRCGGGASGFSRALAERPDRCGSVPAVPARPLAARPLPDLGPGQRVEVVLEIAADPACRTAVVQIVRPDGSVMHRFELVDRLTSRRSGVAVRLGGKVAVVTGGGSGIGRASASALCSRRRACRHRRHRQRRGWRGRDGNRARRWDSHRRRRRCITGGRCRDG